MSLPLIEKDVAAALSAPGGGGRPPLTDVAAAVLTSRHVEWVMLLRRQPKWRRKMWRRTQIKERGGETNTLKYTHGKPASEEKGKKINK